MSVCFDYSFDFGMPWYSENNMMSTGSALFTFTSIHDAEYKAAA